MNLNFNKFVLKCFKMIKWVNFCFILSWLYYDFIFQKEPKQHVFFADFSTYFSLLTILLSNLHVSIVFLNNYHWHFHHNLVMDVKSELILLEAENCCSCLLLLYSNLFHLNDSSQYIILQLKDEFINEYVKLNQHQKVSNF